MSFEKWFKHYEEETGQNRFVCEDMQAAYESGQRDMRELCLCQCSAVQLTSTKEGAASACYIEKLISAIKLESEQ